MKILALLQTGAHDVLERALTDDQRLVSAKDADSAVAALRGTGCDAFVFDPVLVNATDFEAVMRVVGQSRVPMLVYTTLDPLAARRIVEVVEVAAREIVLRDTDDTPELLRAKLAALVRPSVRAMVLSRIAPHLRAFPDPLQTAAVGLFGRTPLPRWVNSLVDETGLARRTVDRWMDNVGIFGAGRLLDVVRFSGVWEPLVEQKQKVEDVCTRCGYVRQRLFIAHSWRLVGTDPNQIAKRYTRESFAARLTAKVLEK